MRYYFFLLLGLMLIFAGNAYAVTTGPDYVNDFDPQKFTGQYFTLPYKQILNYIDSQGNPVYTPYKLSQDSNVVTVQTAEGSFVFDKNFCSISFYNGGLINGSQPVIKSDSYVVKANLNGTQTWNLVNVVNNAPCQTSINENGYSVTVTGTKSVPNAGKFSISYTKIPGHDLKTSLSASNNNTAWTNFHIGVTQTIQVPKIISFGGNSYDLSQFNNTVLDRTWILSHNVQLVQLSNKINFNFGVGLSKLNQITIYWINNQASMAFDYTYNTPILQPGQTITVDPTFGYDSGSTNTPITLTSTSTTCSTASSISTTNNTLTLPSSSTNSACNRLTYQFNTSGLSNAVIDDVFLKINNTSVSNGIACDIRTIGHKPSTSTATQLYGDAGNGTVLSSTSGICNSSVSNRIVDLGSNGISDLQTKLSQGKTWTAYSILFDNETRGSISHQVNFGSSTNIQLGVKYHSSTPSKPLSPATSTFYKKITITYTMPNSKGSSGITNYNLYRASYPYARTQLPALNSIDPESYSGKMNMSGNLVLLHLDNANVSSSTQFFNTTWDASGNKINATTAKVLYATDYSSSSGWTQTGTQVTVNSGVANKVAWVNAQSNADSRVSHPIGLTLNDNSWVVTFDYSKTASSNGILCPLIIGATSGARCDAAGAQPAWAGILDNKGQVKIAAVNSAGTETTSAAAISAQVSNNPYHVRFEKLTNTSYKLSIFNDTAMTVNVAGSPIFLSGASVANSLTTVLHSDFNDANAAETVSATVDNLCFCDRYFDFNHKGLFSNALNFNGVTSYLNITTSKLPTGTSDFTIMGWLDKNNTTPLNMLVYPKTVGDKTVLQVNNTYMSVYSSGFILQNPVTVSTSAWHHVAFVRNGNNWQTYFDGSQTGSNTTSSSSIGTPQSNQYFIGTNYLRTTGLNYTGLLDEYSIFNRALTSSEISNAYQRGSNTLTFVQQAGNVTSINDSGLPNSATEYYRIQAVNANGNGTMSNVIQGTTATTPSTPTNLKANSISKSEIDLSWTSASAGGDENGIEGYQINRNSTTLVNDTHSPATTYTDIGLADNHLETYKVCAWNRVSCSPFTSTVQNTTFTTTTGNTTLSSGVVGDVIQINSTVFIFNASPSPVQVSKVKLYLNGTSIQNETVSQNIARQSSFTFTPFWYQFLNSNNQTFSVKTVVTNSTGTPSQNTIQFNSLNIIKHRQFNPNYIPAKDPTQGVVNYTVTRSSNQQQLVLTVNRNLNAATFPLDCLYQTSFQAQFNNGGFWINQTLKAYGNQTSAVSNSQNYYITCSDGLLFTTTSYFNGSAALYGIAAYNNTFGSFIGVPAGIFFIVMAASLGNRRTAPMWVVIILAIAGMMATIGFFTLSANVWALALIAGLLGLFVGRKLF